ncbi:MAG: TonB-dependent receptor [Bacteroidetes bacterium]|nr:TonB-dependent receptor [Bacteroidota bacterium]
MKHSVQLFILLFLLPAAGFAQNTIKGIIKDTDGLFADGATVGVKGTSDFAFADTAGVFSLTTKHEYPLTLVVKYLGYVTQEIEVTAATVQPLQVILVGDNFLEEIIVTSRRRKEAAQEIPIPVSVVGGAVVAETGAFNVNRLKELIPSVQLYSSNPRNTGLSIRGLGTTFGLTNDGIDPGVGFYVDGVYYARPAAATLDFIDVEQIEVLRGPQGTLFGKNTTAGTFNVTTRKPSFTPGGNFELSYGNYGYIQAKASVTGPLSKKLAGRISFSGTQRDGLIKNVRTDKYINDLNNIGFRAQLLYKPSERLNITLAGDATRQRPDGYAQVFAGVAPTLRAPYRQFEQIIADLNYTLPSRNPFDRIVDHDTPWRSNNDLGGVSLNFDYIIGSGTLTATSAWRYWNWDPSNDRDFTGLQALRLSQATSRHQHWSQEVRWAGSLSSKVTGVFGVFVFGQELNSDPVHIEESGNAQWRFSQSSTSSLWATPGLFDGYGIKTTQKLNTLSAAAFSQIDWAITKRLSVLPGLRFNYDDKSVNFKRETYGGLETTDPALIALKNQVYTNQAFDAQIDDTNFSGQLTLAFKANKRINTFATYSTGFKPVGLNLGGLPSASGAPLIELAVIKPEAVSHTELVFKTTPTASSTLNLTLYNTDIKDYQTQVQSPELGINRGYLANAEKVRVRGVEFDGNIRVKKFLTLYANVAYTDGKYVTFTNAPLPLEETGKSVDGIQVAFKDVSGGALPGISKWAASYGTDLSKTGKFFRKTGSFYIAIDAYYRSGFSSSPSPSKYLVIDGYTLLNARIGFRATRGFSFSIWSRNLLDKDYFEQLLPGAGNAGHYAAVLGDPRTFGVTLRQAF